KGQFVFIVFAQRLWIDTDPAGNLGLADRSTTEQAFELKPKVSRPTPITGIRRGTDRCRPMASSQGGTSAISNDCM
ncbi:hypothetical protein, partial [Mesorhizobium sp.]|uniref:hypothetical protein n=1 Tax=Mesorhizobium sp. TaxID=1871066 RepID=UPI00257BDAE6